MKEKFIFNLKLFIIGIVLRAIIFAYLQSHTGEKQSLIPSLQTLYHKAEIFIYGVLGKNTDQLETKYALDKIYNEISYLIEASHCTDEALLQEVEANKQAIADLTSTQAQEGRYNYYRQASNLKNKIEAQCAIPVSSWAMMTGELATGTSL